MTTAHYVNKNSKLFYRGPSMIDGAPIIGVITGFTLDSENGKTGKVYQTFILREDVHPVEAQREGLDISICGDCFHRSNEFGKRTCYVRLTHGPAGVWKSYNAGNIQPMSADDYAKLAGQGVRFGTYGDPAAIPVEVWETLAAASKYVLGYTHQWWQARFSGMARFCMASVDTPSELIESRDMGYRAFLVTAADDTNAYGLMECRATAIKKHCADCKVCGGNTKAKVCSVFIRAHGIMAKSVAKKLARRAEVYAAMGIAKHVDYATRSK